MGTPRSMIAALAAATALLASTAGCGSGTDDSGEVVITCATCQESPTDPFLQYNHEAAQRFNDAYAGTYRIETIDNPNAGSSDDRLQYYQRLALAGDLPDLFQLNSGEIKALQETGRLHDFAPALDGDEAWAATFHEEAFDALEGTGGQVWAIPQQHDAIGIYYNTALLEAAGYDAFPTTWDAFEDLAAALEAQGLIAIAMDGDWATKLMWANLIGTQDGGTAFLTEDILDSGD